MMLAAPIAHAQTAVNFDDLVPSLGGGAAIVDGYAGLGWSVAGIPMGWMTQGNTTYTDVVCRSQANCGYNGFGNISGMTSAAPITLNGWIRRWNWSNNAGSATSVLIEALNAGNTVVGTQTIALSGSYQAFSLTSLFSTIRFTPTGGTGLGCTGENCGYFLIDDLTINPSVTPPTPSVVPEPSTYALLGTGLVALLVMRRRRSRV
jgi:hypothetical protein